MINKYRIRCTTDNKFEHVLSDSAPTQCPANPAHAVELDSISILVENVGALDGTPIDGGISLSEYKAIKKIAIDLKTRELIEAGITYDNVIFSSSETAQRNWLALDQFKDFHTYPVAVTTDNDGEYTFADATSINTFVLTGMAIINAHYASGRALKVQVNAATDVAGVDAVVDNR